ncbi:hypothetical protein DPMN_100378 [Dreissena polymorpha]|uniref:Uncharacterized protein n=1 Tax=Dreissena polymorpha TaxID=45954 RepID=A0A9D4LHF5_DREPO|nr:hypothetical protein DPMN_100378 [Dreissena polymorpha]
MGSQNLSVCRAIQNLKSQRTTRLCSSPSHSKGLKVHSLGQRRRPPQARTDWKCVDLLVKTLMVTSWQTFLTAFYCREVFQRQYNGTDLSSCPKGMQP